MTRTQPLLASNCHTRLTATGRVQAIHRTVHAFTVTIWQLIVQGTGLTHVTIRGIMGLTEPSQQAYQRLPAEGDLVTFTGNISSVDIGDVIIEVDDIAYFFSPMQDDEDFEG
jgi:hypothetical protein